MLKVRTLSPQLAELAQKELNEKPDEILEHVKKLREWILKQPYLKARTDDQFLVTFLRGSKYDQTMAQQKINLFFTMRSILPEITQVRDIRSGVNAKLLKLGTTIPLPLDPDVENGPRIFLLCPGRYDPKEFHIVDIFKIYVLFTDYFLLNDDNFIVSGLIGILDLTNVTQEHFAQFKPELVKKMTYLCQHASPARPQGFHYINTPNGFEVVFNMFKSCMSEEYKKLLFVHGHNLESLYKHVPKRLLPSEYGGNAGSIDQLIANWTEILVANHESLSEFEQLGSNELFRPGPPITEETIIAMPDSNMFLLP